MARNVDARGGREALAAVRTLRMTGLATAGPGRTAIVRREIARPGRIRTEFVFQGTTGVYAWDGTRGWRVSPLEGSLDARPMSAEEAAAAAEQADVDGALVDWKKKGHRVELVGVDSLAAGPAQHLKVTMKSGPSDTSGSTPRAASSCERSPAAACAGTRWSLRRCSATTARRTA